MAGRWDAGDEAISLSFFKADRLRCLTRGGALLEWNGSGSPLAIAEPGIDAYFDLAILDSYGRRACLQYGRRVAVLDIDEGLAGEWEQPAPAKVLAISPGGEFIALGRTNGSVDILQGRVLP